MKYIQHREGFKLNDMQVLQIFDDPRPQKVIAGYYHVTISMVSKIKTGRAHFGLTKKQYVRKKR